MRRHQTGEQRLTQKRGKRPDGVRIEMARNAAQVIIPLRREIGLRYRNERVAFIDFLNRSRPSDSDYALDSFQNPAERFGMADDGNSNSAELQVILERADPTKNVARYYVLSIEATLFARNTLVRRWGRIGSAGRQRLEFFDGGDSAGLALESWLARKRKRGYMLR